MREATLKTRGVQAREELVVAKANVEECRKQLEYAKEQVGSGFRMLPSEILELLLFIYMEHAECVIKIKHQLHV